MKKVNDTRKIRIERIWSIPNKNTFEVTPIKALLEQVSECYNDVGYTVTWDTTKASFWGNHKREISRIVKIGGKVITS